ncbi:MAG: nucleotidyltransferase family protein [Aureispira sp.]|nr:nucleotidyltransferase family protein [Aureispira sp.]
MQNTHAMLFAAGLGTRLRPLTNDRPKALVELNGKTLLERAILHLKSFGIQTIVINIHHFGAKVLDFLAAHNNFGCTIHISDEREQLLETGGGLQKAAPLLGKQPFIVYNTDVISNLDIKAMYQAHLAQGALATLAVRNRDTSRYLLFNEQLELCGWENINTKEQKIVRGSQFPLNPFAFSGIHVIEPKLFDLMEQKGKFSITTTYLRLAKTERILAYPHNDDYWYDLGKPERLEKASNFLNNLNRT